MPVQGILASAETITSEAKNAHTSTQRFDQVDLSKTMKIAEYEGKDQEGILNKLWEKNRRFEKQKNKGADQQVDLVRWDLIRWKDAPAGQLLY